MAYILGWFIGCQLFKQTRGLQPVRRLVDSQPTARMESLDYPDMRDNYCTTNCNHLTKTDIPSISTTRHFCGPQSPEPAEIKHNGEQKYTTDTALTMAYILGWFIGCQLFKQTRGLQPVRRLVDSQPTARMESLDYPDMRDNYCTTNCNHLTKTDIVGDIKNAGIQ
ncbi:hypothetical protein J6590_090614 [Homalodisca vitripennis]|nr:hypothetical protein J6590_090614 [Homalodisca vitripennis]